MRIACLGAGGMIGGALTRRFVAEGHEVRAVDIKPVGEWIVRSECEEMVGDLRVLADCRDAVADCDRVYLHAASMGGMGFIESHRADCAFNTLITMHVLMAAEDENVGRMFFAGSACCYPAGKQTDPNVTALKESDAFPADAEPGYGWSKLFDELLCKYVREDWGVDTRVGRYHNVAAIPTTWTDPRAKAPAGLSRKVAEAKLSGSDTISIWGDGTATRSFCWIDDAVEGTVRLMESDYPDPVNIGSSELVTVNQLVDVIETAAFGEPGVLKREYDLTAPQGVRGRNSDNDLVKEVLGWEPSTTLAEWIPTLYGWVEDQVREQLAHG